MLAIDGVEPRQREVVALQGRDVADEQVPALAARHLKVDDVVQRDVLGDDRAPSGGIMGHGPGVSGANVVEDSDHDGPRAPVRARGGHELQRVHVTPERHHHGEIDSLCPVGAVGIPAGRCRRRRGRRLPAVVQHGRAGLAEGGVEGPLHGPPDRSPVPPRSVFLKVEFRAPHLGRDLGALAGDLVLGQPPVGCERFPIAPFVDGPPLRGRPLQDGGHRAVRMLVGRGDHRLGSDGPLIHRLPLRSFENRQAHFVGLVESQAGRVRAADGGLRGRERGNRVPPEEPGGVETRGAPLEEMRGCGGRAPMCAHRVQDPGRLLPGATQHRHADFQREGLGEREQAQQEGLAAEGTGGDPDRYRRPGKVALAEGLRRRAMRGAAAGAEDAHPEGVLHVTQQVVVGAEWHGPPTQFSADGGRGQDRPEAIQRL